MRDFSRIVKNKKSLYKQIDWVYLINKYNEKNCYYYINFIPYFNKRVTGTTILIQANIKRTD